MPDQEGELLMARSSPLLGVTGATGRLGGRVARRLAAVGAAQRLLVRDPSRAPQLPGSVPARAPFADLGAVRAARGSPWQEALPQEPRSPPGVGRGLYGR
jgi:hypothetical protein